MNLPIPRKYLVAAAIAGTVVVADQSTKYLAVAELTAAFQHSKAASFSERIAVFFKARHLDGSFDPAHPDLRTAPAVVIPGLWEFRYTENPGAAWSLFAGQTSVFRVPFFHLVTLIALIFLISYLRRTDGSQRLLIVALSLVLGGALGNYLDRLMRSYVIDFVVWHWYDNPRLYWPTFNVADSAICVGVALLLAESLFARRKAVSPAAAAA